MSHVQPAPPLIEVRDATKTYNQGAEEHVALRGVSLTIPETPAVITAIAGESGSGKTTLANAILHFVDLTSGEIRYRGAPLSKLKRQQYLEYRRNVQAIFQDPFGVYNPFYRIGHIFDMVIKSFGLARDRRQARMLIEDALQVVGMLGEDLLEKYPHQLSGGQRQRMMFARAYMLKPRLIVADEPVSMVDASLRAMILEIMLRLREEQHMSFVYITHDLSTAYQVSDELCILYRGTVVEHGAATQIIERPQHEYSRLLISSVPVPDPTVRWDATPPGGGSDLDSR